MTQLLALFESRESGDNTFVEEMHNIIVQESESLYNELFSDTSIEVGKTLSKLERDTKHLTHNKVVANITAATNESLHFIQLVHILIFFMCSL